jgi:DNA-binding MarR family transcriptional regulator
MRSTDSELQLLETIYARQDGVESLTQRDLAGAAGLSLGMTNALLKRFGERGWVKLSHVTGRSLHYILTPEGLAEVVSRSISYFERAERSALLYRGKVEAFVCGLVKGGFDTLVLEGLSELDFLFDYCCGRHGLGFVKDPPPQAREYLLAAERCVFVVKPEGLGRSDSTPETKPDAKTVAASVDITDVLFGRAAPVAVVKAGRMDDCAE